MKKFSFALAYLLSVFCFSCSEDDEKLQLKPDLSKLEIVSERSTNLIDSQKGEIKLVLNNTSANDVEVKAPEFDFPKQVMQIQPNEAIKDNKVSIAAHQEKILTYTFSVNPIAKAQNGNIKVSFAGKTSTIVIKLDAVEDKLSLEADSSIVLLSGQNIENKEIKLVVNNLSGQPIEMIDEPSFKVPEGMDVRPKLGSKDGKINLGNGENHLEYVLSSEALATTGQSVNIKVFFAKKTLNIELKLDPIDKLSFEVNNSIVLLSGQNIENKEIKLIVNNSNGEPIEVNGPSFLIPDGMHITSKVDSKKGKIKLESGENSLEYVLSGKAPVTGQSNNIKMSFAGKTSIIGIKLDLVEDKLSFEVANSIALLSGENIENKEIKLVVNNLNDQSIEVNGPGFLIPDGMHITSKVGSKNGKIKLEKGKNPLEYILSGKAPVTGQSNNIKVSFPDEMYISPEVDSKNGNTKLENGENHPEYVLSGKAPVTGQSNKIEVSFAGKTSTMGIKLDSVEDKLSFEVANSIALVSDQNIENKEIKLVVNNSNGEPIEIYEPSFKVPNGMYVTSKVGSKDGKIKLEKGKNSLEYVLSGKAPVTGQINNIKVSFAGKTSTIGVKLDLVEDKLSFEAGNSIALLSGENIENKEIKLVVNNLNDQPIEVNGPGFKIPDAMHITSKVGSKGGKIKLEKGKNTLEYVLSGKAPVTGESNNIEVFFAGKDFSIELKLISFDELKMVTDKSTRELIFLTGEYIKNKEINLVINNLSGESIEIDEPSFKVPDGMHVTSKVGSKNGKIKLENGENPLGYVLSGKVPITRLSVNIKVSFAGKTSTIDIKLNPVEDKLSFEIDKPITLVSGQSIENKEFKLIVNNLNGQPIEIDEPIFLIPDSKIYITTKIDSENNTVYLEKGKNDFEYFLNGKAPVTGQKNTSIKIFFANKTLNIDFKLVPSTREEIDLSRLEGKTRK